MNEAIKHTPGPWAVGEVKHLIVGDSPRRVIASADMHPRYEVCEANARLIAAAPELLNACREALEIRSLAYQVDANPKLDILTRREIERKVDGIIERIEAAIAKAEGRDE